MTKEIFQEAREKLINSEEYKNASEIQKHCFMNSVHIKYSLYELDESNLKDKHEHKE